MTYLQIKSEKSHRICNRFIIKTRYMTDAGMAELSLIDKIYKSIITKYKICQPFFLKDLYLLLPEMKKGTIRESIRRLNNQEKILKAKNGVYELPNPNRVLRAHVINTSNVVEQTYLKDKLNNIIGYQSGINFGYFLGLTS